MVTALAGIAVDPEGKNYLRQYGESYREAMKKLASQSSLQSRSPESNSIGESSIDYIQLPVSRYILGELDKRLKDTLEDLEFRKNLIENWLYIISKKPNWGRDFEDSRGYVDLNLILDDENEPEELRRFVVDRLAKTGNPSSVKSVISVLEDSKYPPSIRQQAFTNLLSVDLEEAVPPLTRVILGKIVLPQIRQTSRMQQPQQENSKRALNALKRMQNKRALDSLFALANNKGLDRRLRKSIDRQNLTNTFLDRVHEYYGDRDYLAVIQEANKVVELNYSRAANAEAYSFTGWAHYLLAREKKSSYVNAMTALSKAIMNEPKSEWAQSI
jgi:hypothetical protein